MGYHACCEHCAEPFQSKWPARYCSRRCQMAAYNRTPECKARNRERVKAAAAAKRAEDGPRSHIYFIVCEFCDELATIRKATRPRSYCYADKCVRAMLAKRMRDGNWAVVYRDKQRKRIRDTAVVESFRPRDIFERDGWVCGICNEPVDETLRAPDQRSPSLDHIVPLSLHGDHVPDNARLAHLGCNIRRGNRVAS